MVAESILTVHWHPGPREDCPIGKFYGILQSPDMLGLYHIEGLDHQIMSSTSIVSGQKIWNTSMSRRSHNPDQLPLPALLLLLIKDLCIELGELALAKPDRRRQPLRSSSPLPENYACFRAYAKRKLQHEKLRLKNFWIYKVKIQRFIW